MDKHILWTKCFCLFLSYLTDCITSFINAQIRTSPVEVRVYVKTAYTNIELLKEKKM